MTPPNNDDDMSSLLAILLRASVKFVRCAYDDRHVLEEVAVSSLEDVLRTHLDGSLSRLEGEKIVH